MTFLEEEDRNFSDVRLYIQEYPQYASPSQLGSWIDLNDAFQETTHIIMDLLQVVYR